MAFKIRLCTVVLFTFMAWGRLDAPAAQLPAGTIRTDSLGIKQVWVPAGCFMMGSSDQQVQDAFMQGKRYGFPGTVEWFAGEQPQHKVCITKGYWLDQYVVTVAAFESFVKAGGYSNPDFWSAGGYGNAQPETIGGGPYCSKDEFNQSQMPRDCVSWYEAAAYAKWRTQTATDGTIYRLPTEAEWEYAARGPDSLIYPWGNTFDPARLNYCDQNCVLMWADKSGDDGYRDIAPVGSYEQGKNWVNAYDMAGNVDQWVADWYAPYAQQSPQEDPSGPSSGDPRNIRVTRGGSYISRPDDTRSANRGTWAPFDEQHTISFRLVGVVPTG